MGLSDIQPQTLESTLYCDFIHWTLICWVPAYKVRNWCTSHSVVSEPLVLGVSDAGWRLETAWGKDLDVKAAVSCIVDYTRKHWTPSAQDSFKSDSGKSIKSKWRKLGSTGFWEDASQKRTENEEGLFLSFSTAFAGWRLLAHMLVPVANI